MTGERATRFGKDFLSRIQRNLPDGMHADKIHICPSGLVLHVHHGVLTPIGCPVCLGRELHQNAAGNPTVGGQPLLTPDEVGYQPGTIEPELAANLWFCPSCRTPVSRLIPRFDARASSL